MRVGLAPASPYRALDNLRHHRATRLAHGPSAPGEPDPQPVDDPRVAARSSTCVGVFNPAAIRHEGDVLLLLRVAEAPRDVPNDAVAAAVYDAATGRLEIKQWKRHASSVDVSDPRMIVADGRTWLTSISHLRVARSRDGIHFEVEPTPALSPATAYESFGVEDPRITLIDGTYWINYTAVSPYGIATALASTKDFKAFERHGIIFPPNNRDVTIFPEMIGGRFRALHRPMPSGGEDSARLRSGLRRPAT